MHNEAQSKQVVRLHFAFAFPFMWLAHLDRMRTIERILLRANLPITHSQGYNPRPQFVFALPTAAGLSSSSEYIDVYLNEILTAEYIREKLDAQLSDGIVLLNINLLPLTKTSIVSKVRLADYVFQYPDITYYMQKLLEQDKILVKKYSKKRHKDIDIKPFIFSQAALNKNQYHLRARAGSQGNLRADLILQAFENDLKWEKAHDVTIHREEIWILEEKTSDKLIRPIPNPHKKEKEINWHE